MVVRLQIARVMPMVMGAVLAAVLMVVNIGIRSVSVFVAMLVFVGMAVLVGVLVGVGHTIVGMFMSMSVPMLVFVIVRMLVLAFHMNSLSSWAG